MRQKVQTFNDGVVKIYALANSAAAGDMPQEDDAELIAYLRYHQRTVGTNRYYTAYEAMQKVDMLLRCPLRRSVCEQDIAVPSLDGKRYRINLIQYPEDVVPPVMDLQLERIDEP